MKKNKLQTSRFWTCIIGPATEEEVKKSGDGSMRIPVTNAFLRAVNREADICSSQWVSGDEIVAVDELKQSSVYVVEKTCSPKPKKVELTGDELLKLMTNLAREYSVFAVDSIKRNGYALKRPYKEQIDDVLTDFLNFIAGQYGMDYGLKPWHLKEENEDVVKIR